MKWFWPAEAAVCGESRRDDAPRLIGEARTMAHELLKDSAVCPVGKMPTVFSSPGHGGS